MNLCFIINNHRLVPAASLCLPRLPVASQALGLDDVCGGGVGSPGNTGWIRGLAPLQM